MSAIAMLTLAIAQALAAPVPQNFSIPSSGGHVIQGQVDRPVGPPRGAVIMVAGTGAFDRDVRLGTSGTARDAIFADMARRVSDRGMSAVRYDRRGVRHGALPGQGIERDVIASVTADALGDDLGSVHDWVAEGAGPEARCIVFLAHSEGMAHLAELARTGTVLAPRLIVGIGAPLTSKAAGLRWQFVDRDRESIEMMDADRDGITTNAEVEAGWRDTPAAVFNRPDLLMQPDGGWSSDDLDTLQANQRSAYEAARQAAMMASDTDLFPNALAPAYSMGWWKSWFTDERPISQALVEWGAPLALHYGEVDSQLSLSDQRAAAASMGSTVLKFVVHDGLGHTLGPHGLLGPVDEVVADTVAQEVADACG